MAYVILIDMSEILSVLIQFLAEHRTLLYLVAFVTGLVESIPVIGNFSPSTFLLLSFGVIAGVDSIGVGMLVAVVLVGAILSDWLAYYLGSKSEHLFKEGNVYLKKAHVEKGRVFFDRYGTWSVFLGRFVSPVRPVIAFTAGLCAMEKRKFWFFNIVGAIIWAFAYTLPGYFAGYGLQDIDRVDRFLMWAGLGGVAFYVLSFAIYDVTRRILEKRKKYE